MTRWRSLLVVLAAGLLTVLVGCSTPAAQPVEQRTIVAGAVRGDLFFPTGDSPAPGVIVLGGSEGGRPSTTARTLAQQGYAVLALAYFGEPGLPATLQQVPLEVGLDAADWLLAQPEVEGPRLGLVGTSRGGELALLLAATRSAPFAAVVVNAGSDVVFPAGPVGPAASTSSWTLAGRDVPFIPALSRPPSLPAPGRPFRAAPVYAAATAQASPSEFEAARSGASPPRCCSPPAATMGSALHPTPGGASSNASRPRATPSGPDG